MLTLLIGGPDQRAAVHFPGTAAQNPPNCIIMKTIFSPLVLSLCLLAVQPAFSADPALADRHSSRGLACTVCHADMPPKAGVQSSKFFRHRT